MWTFSYKCMSMHRLAAVDSVRAQHNLQPNNSNNCKPWFMLINAQTYFVRHYIINEHRLRLRALPLESRRADFATVVYTTSIYMLSTLHSAAFTLCTPTTCYIRCVRWTTTSDAASQSCAAAAAAVTRTLVRQRINFDTAQRASTQARATKRACATLYAPGCCWWYVWAMRSYDASIFVCYLYTVLPFFYALACVTGRKIMFTRWVYWWSQQMCTQHNERTNARTRNYIY